MSVMSVTAASDESVPLTALDISPCAAPRPARCGGRCPYVTADMYQAEPKRENQSGREHPHYPK